MMEFFRDLFLFICERKKFWMLPVIILLLLISLLLITAGNPVVAPFIYTLF